MSSSAVARLVLGSLAAVGAVTFALSSGGTAVADTTGARTALERTLERSRAGGGPVPVDLDGVRGVLRGFESLGPVHVDPPPAGVRLTDPTDAASLYERAGLTMSTALRAGSSRSGAARLGAPGPSGVRTAGATAPSSPSTKGLSVHVAPSCSGTGTDGKRVQVLYVREQSFTSRYAEMLPLLRNEIANVDDVFALSARQTGGERRVRWVHEGCVPVVQEVVVPDGSLNPSFGDTIDALAGLGFTDKNRKYLAFAEADDLCGVGTMFEDARLVGNRNDGYAASYSRVDQGCWSPSQHSVAAHELTHNLGGVLETAPHATTYGHCTDESDLMCYDDGSGLSMQAVCPTAQEQLLDCNGDDYFNTAPAPGNFLFDHWNTARSGFLDTPSASPAPAGTVWSPPTVTAGERAVVGAVLTDAISGASVPGVAVDLQARSGPAGAWTTVVAGLVTGADGRVSVERRRDSVVRYRFGFGGDPAGAHAPSTSAEVLVKAASKLKVDWRGAEHLVTGRLLTPHGTPVARARVTLQRKYVGASSWVSVAGATSTSSGKVTARQKPRKPAYFRWVYRGASEHLPTRSAVVRTR